MIARAFFIVLLVTLCDTYAAQAQINVQEGKEGEVVANPICGMLTNRSDQTIMGTISTASQKIATGDDVKHRSNFRLSAGEKKEFCTTGPFYEGRRLELVLRTIIPLFSCKTKLGQEIFLDVQSQEGGFRKLSATCL